MDDTKVSITPSETSQYEENSTLLNEKQPQKKSCKKGKKICLCSILTLVVVILSVFILNLPSKLPFPIESGIITIDGYNDINGDLKIAHHPDLIKIIVKSHSLQNVTSVTIKNCKSLKEIEIESESFTYTTLLSLKSIHNTISFNVIFLNSLHYRLERTLSHP